MILNDEALIQIKISSDDLDGATLNELAHNLIVLLEIQIVILSVLVGVTRSILSIGRPRLRGFRLGIG